MNAGHVGQIALAIYAALLSLGGIMGYLKARSKVSLIAGEASAVIAIVALVLSVLRHRLGFPLGLFLAVALTFLFGFRYIYRGAKFMPSGLLAILSLLVVLIMTMAIALTSGEPA